MAWPRTWYPPAASKSTSSSTQLRPHRCGWALGGAAVEAAAVPRASAPPAGLPIPRAGRGGHPAQLPDVVGHARRRTRPGPRAPRTGVRSPREGQEADEVEAQLIPHGRVAAQQDQETGHPRRRPGGHRPGPPWLRALRVVAVPVPLPLPRRQGRRVVVLQLQHPQQPQAVDQVGRQLVLHAPQDEPLARRFGQEDVDVRGPPVWHASVAPRPSPVLPVHVAAPQQVQQPVLPLVAVRALPPPPWRANGSFFFVSKIWPSRSQLKIGRGLDPAPDIQ